MVRLNKISVNLQVSTSPFGFINALHVQVASIGTVPKTFVLFFLFYIFNIKTACFQNIESIHLFVDSAFPLIFINIINGIKFIFQRGKIPSFCCRDISFQYPKKIIYNTQFWVITAGYYSATKSYIFMVFALFIQGFKQGISKSILCITLLRTQVKHIFCIVSKIVIGQKFIQQIKIKLRGVAVVLIVKNIGNFSTNDNRKSKER